MASADRMNENINKCIVGIRSKSGGGAYLLGYLMQVNKMLGKSCECRNETLLKKN